MEERWGDACKGGMRFDFVVAEQNFSIEASLSVKGYLGAWRHGRVFLNPFL